MLQQQQRRIEFIGTCVELKEVDLLAYDESARDINYRTFSRHLGAEGIQEIERAHGYGQALRLRQDYHVRYSRGKWQGKPAICMMHSAIHHLWFLPS